MPISENNSLRIANSAVVKIRERKGIGGRRRRRNGRIVIQVLAGAHSVLLQWPFFNPV